MTKLGKKALTVALEAPIAADDAVLHGLPFECAEDGRTLRFAYDARSGEAAMGAALRTLIERGVAFTDVETRQSSLEDIFVDLVRGNGR